ncbi:MAG: hypothetical protein ACI3VX_05515 [Faecousia sp.]
MKKRIIAIVLLLALCFSLTACKSNDYEAAVALLEAGDYQAAAEAFAALGDYKNAADKLTECTDMIAAIDLYETATKDLADMNGALDAAVSEADALVQSEEKALDESLRTDLETTVTKARAEKVEPAEMPATAKEITDYVATIAGVDYTDAIASLQRSLEAFQQSQQQYALVNNPSEAAVIAVLEKIPGVTGISAATEDNDPNGQLHKAGGYSSAVYFSHENVDQNDVLGDTIIDKGTKCGGQLEVYTTEEDAMKRDEYLASFDGTILSSGAHTVIGTIVVRVSDDMTATQQQELTALIIEELTRLP